MIGTTLAHYKVTAALGEGGMGQVWRAEDEKLGREVALKVLPEEFARDPERMARFEREAKVLASLNHPNIATLYGLESVSGTAANPQTGSDPASSIQDPASIEAEVTFLVMELVGGEDLSERIKRGPVPLEEATAIALQIAEALEAAHEQGINRKSVRGTGDAELVFQADANAFPESWSPDGRYLAFSQSGATTDSDVWILDLEGERTASIFYQTDADDGAAAFSPDGRWLAYWSQESGRGEVYVTSFPDRGRRVQVSKDSGTWIEWSRDGRSIFYQKEDSPLKRANVDGSGDTFKVGTIEDVAQLDTPTLQGCKFAVAPDGERVLTARPRRQADSPLVELVVGWMKGLEEMQ